MVRLDLDLQGNVRAGKASGEQCLTMQGTEALLSKLNSEPGSRKQ